MKLCTYRIAIIFKKVYFPLPSNCGWHHQVQRIDTDRYSLRVSKEIGLIANYISKLSRGNQLQTFKKISSRHALMVKQVINKKYIVMYRVC